MHLFLLNEEHEKKREQLIRHLDYIYTKNYYQIYDFPNGPDPIQFHCNEFITF